ncbi:3149_t:CDS:2 [Ambispora gerdemannii]|uniref:3149_t:CDS:1 n=1 Tax=Ambispora gerdemannii TaxID=144530 RepID=A0A9N9DG93_9GLOM|nr:3149_t:CDS:2 [Ambispora gerdemannii]
MANTQSRIVLLEKQNSKLVSKITELREKNAILLAENVKLKPALEKYEVRFINLEQKDKEKTSLITKLADDIKEIKQSSTNVSPKINPNNTPEQMSQNDSPKGLENTSDNTFNSDTCQPIYTKSKSLEKKEVDRFLDSTYRESVSKEIIQSIKEKKLQDQELFSTPKNTIPNISQISTSLNKNVSISEAEKLLLNRNKDINVQDTKFSSESSIISSSTQVQIVIPPKISYNQKVEQDLIKKFPEAEVSTSSNPTHDRTYFHNKILERYPDLYYEYSNEDVNYYGITTESLCPICKLIHEDEEGIEDNYKAGSYYIKCEQRGIEIKDISKTKLNKILTPKYLDWQAKLTDLPSILTDKHRSKLYNRYKKKTGLNPWIKSENSEFLQIEEEAKCPIYKEVHTRQGIWGDWSCLGTNDHYFLNCPFRIDQKKVIIVIQSLPEIQVRIPNKISNSPIHPNKIHLYQYAVENDLDPEKFSVITEAEKDRWAMGCFRGDLKRDICFYHGGIESKEDSRKYRKFLTDQDRLIGEELLHRSILRSGLSTA